MQNLHLSVSDRDKAFNCR